MDDMDEGLVNFLVDTLIQSEKISVKRKCESWHKLEPSIKKRVIRDPVEQFKKDYQNAKPYESDMGFYMLATGKLMTMVLKELNKEEGEVISSSDDENKIKKPTDKSDRSQFHGSPKPKYYRKFPLKRATYKYGLGYVHQRSDFSRRHGHHRDEHKRHGDKSDSEKGREREKRDDHKSHAKKSHDRVDRKSVEKRRDRYDGGRHERDATDKNHLNEKHATNKPDLEDNHDKKKGADHKRRARSLDVQTSSTKSVLKTRSHSCESHSVTSGPCTTSYSFSFGSLFGRSSSSANYGSGSSEDAIKTPRHPDEERIRTPRHSGKKRHRHKHGKKGTPQHPHSDGKDSVEYKEDKNLKHTEKNSSSHPDEAKAPLCTKNSRSDGKTDDKGTVKQQRQEKAPPMYIDGGGSRNIHKENARKHGETKKSLENPVKERSSSSQEKRENIPRTPIDNKTARFAEERDDYKTYRRMSLPEHFEKKSVHKHIDEKRRYSEEGKLPKHHEELKSPKDHENGRVCRRSEDRRSPRHTQRRRSHSPERPPKPTGAKRPDKHLGDDYKGSPKVQTKNHNRNPQHNPHGHHRNGAPMIRAPHKDHCR